MGYVYILRDPISNQIRYIGKTSGSLNNRLSSHLCEANKSGRKNRRVAWIKGLIVLGYKPYIESIFENENEHVLLQKEIDSILEYRKLGYNLTEKIVYDSILAAARANTLDRRELYKYLNKNLLYKNYCWESFICPPN